MVDGSVQQQQQKQQQGDTGLQPDYCLLRSLINSIHLLFLPLGVKKLLIQWQCLLKDTVGLFSMLQLGRRVLCTQWTECMKSTGVCLEKKKDSQRHGGCKLKAHSAASQTVSLPHKSPVLPKGTLARHDTLLSNGAEMLKEKQGEMRRCNWERSQPAGTEICLAENRRFRLDSQSPKKICCI